MSQRVAVPADDDVSQTDVAACVLPTVRGQLSALRADPSEPRRGLLLALHGGATNAHYWHHPVTPSASLLRRGATCGWTVLAPDRPGYGASRRWLPTGLPVREQARLIAEALERAGLAGEPTVVVAHSLGTLVSFALAGERLLPGLAGLTIGGVPIVFTDEQRAGLDAADLSGARVRRGGGATFRDLGEWYGPPGTWDPALRGHRRTLSGPTPSAEMADLLRFVDDPTGLLADVWVPVQVTAGQYEATTAPSAEIFAELRAGLPATVPVETAVLTGSGHNLSLGLPAADYHDRVLAFADAVTGGGS